jgi:uncharacterized protein (TIGR03437 family)
MLLCGTAVASGQAVSFSRPSAIAAVEANSGSAVLSLVTADFNGDGKADIAYIGYIYGLQSYSLTVSLGNGDGTFKPEVTVAYYSDTAITCCGAADVDGDGKVDLILTDAQSNSILVYPGNGDGTFRAPVRTPLGNKGSVGFVTIADVNHDGKPDILMGTFVFLGNGDGTFRLHYMLDGGIAQIADFNHDGNADVILVLASGQLAICLGHGDGTFGQDLTIATPFPSQNIIAGDFNGDGEIALAMATAPGINQTADIAVLPGKGDGTFLQPVTTSGLIGPITAAADFNHDGKLDLIAITGVLLGLGNGRFRPPVFFGVTNPACAPDDPAMCSISYGVGMIADFNGDGLPDVAVATQSYESPTNTLLGVISLFLNDSPGDGFLETGVSSATYTWPVGANSLVSTFGVNLAPFTEPAQTAPLPTTLGGIRVHVLGAGQFDDQLAPLLYVSPTQINFEIQASGPFAYVGIEKVGSPFVARGMGVMIQPLAPGLFTLDASGLAAANAVRVSPGGMQTPVPVSSCVIAVCAGIPIDVTGAPVYLSLYGTGFSSVATSDTRCDIAGMSLEPSYAGPQTQIPGLDQINILLPSSLAGSGESAIRCSFGLASPPATTNTLHVRIR